MNKLIVSSSPHIASKDTTQRIMLDVVIALMPAAIAAAVIFGLGAIIIILTCMVSCVLAEYLFNLITKKKQTVGDLTAVVTGLILALNLRADAPLWQCVIGAVFAIVVVKCLFGGLGCNFANPAATARVFLLVCFAGTLAGGAKPLLSSAPELVSGATPLVALSSGAEMPSLLDMFLGLRGGAMGEGCIAAILLGFIYLVVRKVIYFEPTLIFVGTVFVLSLIIKQDIVLATYEILGGGLLIGAIFMATDYVTTPTNRLGKSVFCLLCGIITVLIRFYGYYPEGVSFSILFMNIVCPYIQKITRRKPLGSGGVKNA